MSGSTVDRRMRTASLRRRVTISVLVLLVVVLTLLGLVVNWLLGDALRSDLQQRLQDKASYAAVLQEQGVTGQTLADRLAGGGIFSSFTSGREQFIGRDSDPPARPPADDRAHRPPTPTPTVAPVVAVAESAGRMTATVILPNGTLTLSAPEDDIATTLSRLTQIELLAGAATVLVAGLLLMTVVRAALRPLDRMFGLAHRIRDGARGGRLRPTKPGTDLGRTAAAFDGMLDALEAAEVQARSAEVQMRQFLADASHDLRTPLAGVIAGAEQLLRTPATRAEREDRLVQVIRQARRAARLVDDLLLMTRLDPASRDGDGTTLPALRCSVDPIALIEQEVSLLRLRRPDLHVVISAGPAVAVNADPDQLQRAFGNLLENAAAASAPGGSIAVHAARRAGLLSIQIQDRGPGVPEDQRERIFDRFVRLSAERGGDGSGLGLPISRAILRAGDGDLRCLPWTGGACFEVVLPALAPPAHRVPQLTG